MSLQYFISTTSGIVVVNKERSNRYIANEVTSSLQMQNTKCVFPYLK